VTEPNPALLAKLMRSVAILAMPYDSQAVWLSSVGLGDPEFADELALELEDGALLSRQFEKAGWLSADVRQAVTELDALLGDLSGEENEDFWRIEALRESPDWERVRDLALKALLALR